MNDIILYDPDKSNNILSHCLIAENFLDRLVGCLGKKQLKQDEGILFLPCNSVHTYFMRFSIDVIFLDKNMTILHCIENMSPWSISPIVKNSYCVIEMQEGKIREHDLQTGQKLLLLA